MNKSKCFFAVLLMLVCASVWAQKDAAYWQGRAVSLSETDDGGEYYIYSPKYEMFLGRGNDWGTRATLDYQGLTWAIASVGDGIYTLKNTSRDGHALGYLYIDQDDESLGWVYTNTTDLTKASTKWTIAPVDGRQNTYTIRSSQGCYLFRSADGTTIDKTTSIVNGDDKFYWLFIPKTSRESTDDATMDNPIDVTYYIYDQNMDYYGGEAANSGRGHWVANYGSPNWKGGLGWNTCAEVWNGTFDVNQTLSVPNGFYRLKAQGFYRIGRNGDAGGNNASEAAKARANGSEVINAVFYANDEKAKFPSIFDNNCTTDKGADYIGESWSINGTTYYVPTGMNHASKWFSDEAYETSIVVEVTNGTLTIGARNDVDNPEQWAIFDNFRLEYLGGTAEPSLEGCLYTEVAGQKKFLTRGYSWSTRAILGDYGIPMRIGSVDDDGNTKVMFLDSQKYLYSESESNLYTDGNFDDARIWMSIISDGADGYILKANNSVSKGYVGVYDGWKLKHETEKDAAIVWHIMSKNDYDKILAQRDEAGRYAGYGKAGIAELPELDVVRDAAATGTDNIAEEFWNTRPLSITKNYDGIEPGLYKVSIKAFYRIGGYANEFAQAKSGYNYHQAFLTVNGQAVLIHSALDSKVTTAASGTQNVTIQGVTYYIPDNLDAANSYFDKGYYENVVYAIVGNDGKMDVSITCDGWIDGCWCAYRDLVITRMSETPISWDDVDAGAFCLENNDVSSFMRSADYTQQGAASVVPKNIRNDVPNPVTIRLPLSDKEATVHVSTKESDYSDAVSQIIASGSMTYDIYNLVPGMTYYYKVEVDGNPVTNGHFTTGGVVRMIKTENGSNVRDLGGRITVDGRKVRYGRLFRGGELRDGYTTTASDNDIEMLKNLGIKAELDLRSTADTNNGSVPSKSCLDGDYLFLDLVNFGTNLCDNAENREKVRKAISFIAKNMRNNNPVYFHCIWGADRTGAIAFFIENILGFTLDDMYKDFELTSFSKAGHRAANYPFGLVLEDKTVYCQENHQGNTIQEKVVDFLRNGCGVTDDEINTIRNYMLEDNEDALAERYKSQKAYYQGIITMAGAEWNTAAADQFNDISALKVEYNRAMNALETEVDLTSLIANGKFDTDPSWNGWVARGTVNYGGEDNLCAEIFMSQSSLRQSLNDMPAGTYILKMQAFQSNGGANADVYKKYLKGEDGITSYIMLNDNHTTVRNICEDARNTSLYNDDNPALGVYMPNSLAGAGMCFASTDNLYWNVTEYKMDEEGCLTFGVAQTGTEDRDWTAFDNVRLYYRGEGYYDTNIQKLNDDETVVLPSEDGYYTIQGDRVLKANCWNTLCVPFDLTSGMMETAGVSAIRTLNNITIDGNKAHVEFADAKEMKAGRPYIVRVRNDYNISSVGRVLVRAKSPVSVMVDNGSMTGYYSPYMNVSDIYYIKGNDAEGNQFVYADDKINLHGLRAYITIPEAANVKFFDIVDVDADGIESVIQPYEINARTYSLQGIAVDETYKGVILVNGRKVLRR